MHLDKNLGFDFSTLLPSIGQIYSTKLQLDVAKARARAEQKAAEAAARAASLPSVVPGVSAGSLNTFLPYIIGGTALAAALVVAIRPPRK